MISLAPFRYRKILAKDGGPIEELRVYREEIGLASLGYEATAWLRSDIRGANAPKFEIYSNCDGTGSSKYKNLACYKAISEALERWAFLETSTSKDRKYFGFDFDPTTNGIAAFPGLSSRNARDLAWLEALERWALKEWWVGALQHESVVEETAPDRGTILICVPSSDHSVVLTWRFSESCQGYCYGFAAASQMNAARQKAMVEMLRNQKVLSSFRQRRGPNDEIGGLLRLQENRLLYFSSATGFSKFQERIKAKATLVHTELPKLRIDRALSGGWSKFTDVWRVLFDGQERDIKGDVLDFFMF